MALHRPDTARKRKLVGPLPRTQAQPGAAPQAGAEAHATPMLDDPELAAMRQAAQARDIDLHPFSERNKRRWKKRDRFDKASDPQADREDDLEATIT